MKKLILNRKLAATLGIFIVLVFLAVAIPNQAHAQLSMGFSAFNPFTWVAAGIKLISYIINVAIGFLFQFASWLVDIAMNLNNDILGTSNTVVKIGWTICRDIANLGFVLIMVVMAVATIVRYEKYSAKQLLPILIGAAIIVNFSLTISGVLINFSNILSNTFTSSFSSSGANNMGIVNDIVEAFGPQRLLLKDTDNPSPPDPASQGSDLTGFSAGQLISITGSIFSVVFLAIATLSMGTLALMLLYRYVMLSILLILAPLTWMFWVFPDLKSLFNKWWDKFITWVFFLPATTFFLYLAIQAARAMDNSQIFGSGSNFSGLISDIMKQGAQMVVLTGLLLGGLIAAQKMGIEAAGGAINLAKKAKDGALSFTGRKALQYGSYAVRSKWGKEGQQKSAAEAMVGWASKVKAPIFKQAAGYLARGATKLSTAGGEGVLKEHEAAVSKMAIPDVQAALLTASGPRRIALIKRLSKDKRLGDSDMTNIATEDTRSLFARFNQGKDFSDVEKNGLMTVKMAQALESKNEQALAEATDKLVASMTRKDLETAAVKDLFSGKRKFGLEPDDVKDLAQNFARALESENPGLVPSMIPKFDSPSRKNFTSAYTKELDESLKLATPGTPPYEDIIKMKKQFETVLANYTVGFSPVEETTSGGGGGASTPPPSGGNSKP